MPRHATRTSFRPGSEHPCWKGGMDNLDALSPKTVEVYCRKEAHRLMNCPSGLVVHHKDGNVRNNSPENLQVLTQSEHVAIHNSWRRGQRKKNSLQEKFKDVVLSSCAPSRILAHQLGISKNTVQRIRRYYDFPKSKIFYTQPLITAERNRSRKGKPRACPVQEKFRDRVLELSGLSSRKVAGLLGIGVSTVNRIRKNLKKEV